MQVTVLTETEIRQCVGMDQEAIAVVEDGFTRLANAEVTFIELGDLTSGRKPGRSGDKEITICDLTGVGVQDTAIALLAYRKAMQKGLGLRI